MDQLERSLFQTDFSRYTDQKERLARELFSQKKTGKTVPFRIARISDSDVEYVNAAQGLTPQPQSAYVPTRPTPGLES